MASVNLPSIDYIPSFNEDTVPSGMLSDAQIEAVSYAGAAHEQILASGVRRGFFIGDGTGVGKGREIAGIIMDNKNKGRERAILYQARTGTP